MNEETEIDFDVLRFATFQLLRQAKIGFERTKDLAEDLRNAKQEDVAKAVESVRDALKYAVIELDKAYETLKRRERRNR